MADVQWHIADADADAHSHNVADVQWHIADADADAHFSEICPFCTPCLTVCTVHLESPWRQDSGM